MINHSHHIRRVFFLSSRRRHTRLRRDWSSDVCSSDLPCYQSENVTKQRGNGVFEKSIRCLQLLNSLGYGSSLPLHLVYNPVGPTIPPPQAELETDYKNALNREFGIRFNHLFTITNQPIARFANDLREQGKWVEYLELLATSFNPTTVAGLMCRNTLSVGYEG